MPTSRLSTICELYMLHNEQVWTCPEDAVRDRAEGSLYGGGAGDRAWLGGFREFPVQLGPSWTRVWTCPGESPKYIETPPWTDRHITENITFPQLRWQAVIIPYFEALLVNLWWILFCLMRITNGIISLWIKSSHSTLCTASSVCRMSTVLPANNSVSILI